MLDDQRFARVTIQTAGALAALSEHQRIVASPQQMRLRRGNRCACDGTVFRELVILPNTDQAVIAEEKLRDYLLSPTHLVGRHKATFFRSLGYTQQNWRLLASDLRTLLRREATLCENTAFGTKYEITGDLDGPSGQSARIITAWIILRGEDLPRFITAYPG